MFLTVNAIYFTWQQPQNKQDGMLAGVQAQQSINREHINCLMGVGDIILVPSALFSIMLPCEASGFMRSHQNRALICYIACPEYNADTKE